MAGFEVILIGARHTVGGIKLPSGRRLPPLRSHMECVTSVDVLGKKEDQALQVTQPGGLEATKELAEEAEKDSFWLWPRRKDKCWGKNT